MLERSFEIGGLAALAIDLVLFGAAALLWAVAFYFVARGVRLLKRDL
jgi:hypothetical protein